MEICRKLDSIRASGFPDADGATTTGGEAVADASDVSGPPHPRPRSEPLPESIPGLASASGKERRPGTAASGSGTDASGPFLRGEPRGRADDATAGTAPETESVADDGLEREEGAGANSSSGIVGPSPKGQPKHTSSGSGSGEEGSALEAGGGVFEAAPVRSGSELDNTDGSIAEESGVPSVVVASTARNRDQKASSTRREKVRLLRYRAGGVYPP